MICPVQNKRISLQFLGSCDIRCDGFSVRLSSIIRRVPFPSPLIRACSFQRTDPHIDIRNTEAKCSAFHFRIPVFLTGQLCNRRSLLNIPIIDDIYRNAGCPLACLFTTYSSFSKTSGVFFRRNAVQPVLHFLAP